MSDYEPQSPIDYSHIYEPQSPIDYSYISLLYNQTDSELPNTNSPIYSPSSPIQSSVVVQNQNHSPSESDPILRIEENIINQLSFSAYPFNQEDDSMEQKANQSVNAVVSEEKNIDSISFAFHYDLNEREEKNVVLNENSAVISESIDENSAVISALNDVFDSDLYRENSFTFSRNYLVPLSFVDRHNRRLLSGLAEPVSVPVSPVLSESESDSIPPTPASVRRSLTPPPRLSDSDSLTPSPPRRYPRRNRKVRDLGPVVSNF
jgi:hypothetical protein